MILRTYRVRVRPGKQDVYEKLETEEGVAMVRSMAGCVAAGFGRVSEEAEPTYVFFSFWTSRESLDAARATGTWKGVAEKLEGLALTEGHDVAEHIEAVTVEGLGS